VTKKPEDYTWQFTSRFFYYPENYPIDTSLVRSAEDLAHYLWSLDTKAKLISNKLDVPGWYAVNNFSNGALSWESWVKLDDLVKKALLIEAESLANKQRQAQQQQELKYKDLLTNRGNQIKFNSTNPLGLLK
jgi:hypothetical protein